MKLGEKIKQLRSDAGLTQPELASKANIEQSYLSKLENDKGSPSFEVIAKIASAFELDVMTLIESLDLQYLQEHLAHLPEIAIKLNSRQRQQQEKVKKGYLGSAAAIVFGIALVILGNSTTIFPVNVYQYKSMGLLNKGEINQQFSTFPLSELGENRAQAEKRIAANIPRIDEELVLTRSYRGDAYVEHYGPKRRYFNLIDHKEVESPLRDISTILGFILLTSGGFGLVYVFRFISTKVQ